MEEDIFTKVKTTESAAIFKDELELLLKSLYQGSQEFNSVLKTKVRANLSGFIKNKILQEDIDIEEFLKNLIKKMQSMPTVRLIIAYEPSEEAVDRFYSYIAGACQRHVLLDIGYAPEIVGGAVIIYNGKYKDFSFKRVFEEEFSKEQDYIMKLLEK